MTFTVESGIPVPARKGGRAGGSKYPFATMEIGQSFLVDSETKIGTIRSAVGAFTKTHKGYRFAIRQTDEGVRVWRVALKVQAQDTEDGEE
jgi:hypothetical protein